MEGATRPAAGSPDVDVCRNHQVNSDFGHCVHPNKNKQTKKTYFTIFLDIVLERQTQKNVLLYIHFIHAGAVFGI